MISTFIHKYYLWSPLDSLFEPRKSNSYGFIDVLHDICLSQDSVNCNINPVLAAIFCLVVAINNISMLLWEYFLCGFRAVEHAAFLLAINLLVFSATMEDVYEYLYNLIGAQHCFVVFFFFFMITNILSFLFHNFFGLFGVFFFNLVSIVAF
jgi:hypothetical protein